MNRPNFLKDLERQLESEGIDVAKVRRIASQQSEESRHVSGCESKECTRCDVFYAGLQDRIRRDYIAILTEGKPSMEVTQ